MTREKLDEISKEKLKESEKIRLSNLRQNLDESAKEKIKASDKKRKSYVHEKTLMKAPKKK